MFKIVPIAAALVAAGSIAFAQDDSASARELDDSSVVAPAARGAADAIDDADRDAGGDLSGAQAVTGPLAFGVVTASGSMFSGTPNFTASYNATYNRYEITISGQNYYYLNYATVITPAGDQRFCKSSSVGGRLLVYCYDVSGQAQTSRFGFITFKP